VSEDLVPGGMHDLVPSESSISSDEEQGMCPICMDTPISVVVSSCQHGLCVQCAFQLTVKGRELPSCPFCRQKIGGFEFKVARLHHV
jgi:formate dehydrogenase maturation protein FdhE